MNPLVLSLAILIAGPVIASAQTALRPGSQNVPWGAGVNVPATSSAVAVSAENAKPLTYPIEMKKKSGSGGGGGASSLTDLFNQALNQRPGASGGLFGSTSGGGSGGSYAMGDLRDCGDKKPDIQALDTMVNCANKKLSMASNAKGALVDVDQKVMFVVNRATRTVEGCVNISTGKSTGDQKGQTPTGMLITGPHDGGKYQSNADGTRADCIGLRGTDAETIKRANNGVVIHKAHGRAGLPATAGCIGVEDSKFDAIKDVLYGSDSNPKSSAIFIYDKDSRHNCDGSKNFDTPELQDPGASGTGS